MILKKPENRKNKKSRKRKNEDVTSPICLQKFIRIQKIVKKVIHTENKETIKEQEKNKF